MMLCYTCIHMRVDEYVPDWSDITPGNPFAMYCNKRHWEFNPEAATTISLQLCLEHALTCPDYTDAQYVNLNEPQPQPPKPRRIHTCHKCSSLLTKGINNGGMLQTACLVCSHAVLQ